MPVSFQVADVPVTAAEALAMWQEVVAVRKVDDHQINVRSVSEEEIRQLNQQYRGKDKSTNVLTFSYDDEHDIALCMPVAIREAAERSIPLRDYVALLLVHAFLHASGMDHERSDEESEETKNAEKAVLQNTGFTPHTL